MWHKLLGVALVVAGVAVFVVNDFSGMPGGHNELWAIAAIAIAAPSMWWFGWFDRPPTRG